MTDCDTNSGFYSRGKKSVFDPVAKSPVARRQLSRCGGSLKLEKDVVEQSHDMSSTVTTRVAP